MMLVIAECYEIGAYYTDESGYLQENEITTKAVLKKYEPELHYEGQLKEEVFTNSEGYKVMVRCHPDSNNILYATTIDNDGSVKEIAQYFQSKIVQRTSYKRVEGFSSCIRQENWFNSYEVYEEYFVNYKPKYSKTKMERRYINGVMKQEIIYPDT